MKVKIEHQVNNTDKENPKYSGKTVFSATNGT